VWKPLDPHNRTDLPPAHAAADGGLVRRGTDHGVGAGPAEGFEGCLFMAMEA
jgi:hypothetical protein